MAVTVPKRDPCLASSRYQSRRPLYEDKIQTLQCGRILGSDSTVSDLALQQAEAEVVDGFQKGIHEPCGFHLCTDCIVSAREFEDSKHTSIEENAEFEEVGNDLHQVDGGIAELCSVDLEGIDVRYDLSDHSSVIYQASAE